MVNQWLRVWSLGVWMVVGLPGSISAAEKPQQELSSDTLSPTQERVIVSDSGESESSLIQLDGRPKRSLSDVSHGSSDSDTQPAYKRRKLTIYDPKYDSTFKMVFAEAGAEERTIHFLNTILDRQGEHAIKHVTILSGSIPGVIRLDKTIIFDIRCQTENGETFIIEMQKASMGGVSGVRFPARVVYYATREFSEQSRKLPVDKLTDAKAFYDELLPVHVLSILGYNEFPKKDLLVHWDIVDRKTQEISTNLLGWTFVQLRKFNKTDPKELENPFDQWLYFLRCSTGEVEVTEEMVGYEGSPLAQAYQRMALVALNAEERAIAEEEHLAAINQHTFMVASKEEGREEGRVEGRVEGREEGREEGRAEERKNAVRNMLEQKFNDVTIKSALNMSTEELQAIKDKIASEQASE